MQVINNGKKQGGIYIYKYIIAKILIYTGIDTSLKDADIIQQLNMLMLVHHYV